MIFEEGSPAASSLAMSSSTNRQLSRMPSSSSELLILSRLVMSYHPVMTIPMLRVMGLIGAVGKMNFSPGMAKIPAILAHPSAVSPSPWSISRVALCSPLGSNTVGSG
eukprot:CAMPEP_0117669222 /NCGR_PEP_ID=MMETSP0804-20121206/12003_1 /TAXON_ID=1074897 /ORGANISM="Tetraselmis astigmatica, Strain CCMP880" /LENGTH=107 /DNA_ID=CAMNT_0005477237 /DNA_START=698 /DNA_END=1021 /DNA_ORIENTATION=+